MGVGRDVATKGANLLQLVANSVRQHCLDKAETCEPVVGKLLSLLA